MLVRGLILIAGLVTLSTAAAQSPPQPNVVLILADDLGYGDVGAFGATDISTPNIDRLASEGVMLSDYYVAPSCSISRVMLMTGSYAPRTGMSRNFTPSSTLGIHADEVTLGDLAKSAGYATGIFGKWHLGDHYQFRPLRHGFDEFFGIPHSSDMWPFHPLMPVTADEDPRLTAARARAELTGYAGQGSTFPTGEGFPNLPLYDGDSIVEFNSDQSIFGGGFVDRAVDFIERHSAERFFVYVPLTAPHVPLHPSAAFVGTSARDLYGDTVQEVDFGVGRILDKLVELGIDDETLVIFVSDNGPWLEYGIDGGLGMPFTGGKETQLEGGIRVPAVIRWPGQLTSGTVIDEPLSATDFLPTLAGLVGVPVPSDRTIDGVDIWPLLTGQVSSLSRQAIFGFDEANFSLVRLGAIRSGNWKLHVNTSGSSVTPVALFDLATDPAESTDVTSGNAGVVSSLTTLGEQIVADILANQRSLGQVTLSGEPFVQSSGFGDMIAIEAEHFHARQARSGHNWDIVTEPHNSAGEAIRAQPNNGANINTDYVTTSPHLEYRIDVGTPGRYYVWVRAKGASNADDSVHVGIDGVASPNGYRVSDFESYWTWSSTLMGSGARAFLDIPAGEHVLDLWMREDGVIIDKIVLTSDAQFEPEGQGLVESQQGTLGPALQFSTSTLGYMADEGDTTPLSQVMSLTTSDSTAATFSLSSSEPSWLTVSPASGTTPAGTLTVTANPSGLAAGQYTGTITATASGYVQDTVDVTLTVVGDSGVLSAAVSSTASNVNLTAEGSGDWAHWGLSSASSVNRKSGVTTQIGTMTALGSSGRRFQGGSSRSSYNWTDGTPTGSASTTAGLYFQGAGNGFQFTVPADTTAKTLTVHLGGYRARGQIEVSLSDGTVPPYVTTVEDLSNPFDRSLTINFQAASPGQTLTVRYSKLTGDNLTLQAATLVGEVAPPQPSLELSTSTLSFTADEGDTTPLSQVMSLTTSDSTAATFSLSSSEPSWLTVSPASGTTPAGTLTVTANPSGLAAGQYTGTITATASGYVQDTVDVTLTVVGDSGVLSAAVSSTASNVNLTAEGSGDWAHWGLSSASSVNRKSGVTTQIGTMTALGSSGRRFQGGSSRSSYNWTDGTPTGSASTTAGLYFQGAGNGFQFTVPADTTAKTLTVHLGGYRARGQIEVSLSDGTVPPYVTTVEDLSNPFDRSLTINFQAASPGQTLTVRYSKLTGDNLTLQAATLVGEVAPPQPSLELSTSTLSFTADEGDTTPLSQVMSLTTSDSTAATFSLSSSEPSWLTVSPASGTTPAGTLTVTANPSGLAAGQYTGTITATASGYVQDTVDVTLTVVGDSGVLSAAVSSTASNVNLTAEGSGDWAHWGLSSASSVNRKSGVTTQIGTMTALGSSGRRFQGGSSRSSYNWTDGTPTGSASTTAGLYFQGAGNGFQFTVPADTTAKTLTVHLGGYRARGQIEVSLSDGTVPPYVTTVEDLSNPFDRSLTINFQAASPGQTLTVRYSKLTGDNLTLQAATLVGEVAPLALPFSDNFDDGNSDGWAFVNETPLADAWSAGSGSLTQANAIESVASFEESFHLGSYAWLPAGTSLTDYRVSARLERTGAGRAESFGILFRYRDVDNFYRFTLNTRYGFGRLEKREGGVYFTLAVNAFGDDPSSPFTLGIDVDGQDIRVSVDGSPVMAATDGAHAAGSIGLVTQSPTKFDDVVIAPIVASPDVKLVSPVPMTVVPGSQVDAKAVVRGLPAGGAVEFSMTGQAPVALTAPPWETTFSSVPAGPVTLTIRILDAGNNPVDSHNVDFAIGGDYVVAIGDSITNGIGDTYAADNDDALRVFSNTAYASVLANRLEAMPPTEVIIYNEGIGGDDAAAADLLRLQTIIDRHPSGSAALVQLGTNDANAGRTAIAFESDMQSIVDRLAAESMTVYVATLPPILGGSNPLSSVANQRVVQYNDEITNNLAGALPGADLWAYFAPDDTGDDIADRVREDLFADDLHPNALGHAIIADLWYNVLLGDSTGTSIVPFAADALSRPNYKQNLLEPGDVYLIDSAATVTEVPTALTSAVWIMPAQSDAGSTAASFLEFDLDRGATVYVAYDADAALLPEWLNSATSGFVDTGTQLMTTQTNYRIFSAPFGTGNVSLGGNHATGGGDAADMYLVGLLPDP